MRDFQLGRYIKRWLPLVIAFLIVMTIFSNNFISKRQTYVASTVIEYCNKEAADGLAPDGTEINTAEIYSSANMARVMENLGLSIESYSLDSLCNSISVQPVLDDQASAIQEAVNKEGEEYTSKPTIYIVSCTLDYTGSQGQAQMILNELLDVYFADYSRKHINSPISSNQTADILDSSYDYLEMIEIIDGQLNDTVNDLNGSFQRDQSFRSAKTGYSFAELVDQFDLLQNVDVAGLYAMVLRNQITKDKALLINKYTNRIQDYKLDSTHSRDRINDVLKIVDSYLDKLRSSGNTDIDYNYILDEVHDDWRKTIGEGENAYTEAVDRTVQYDKLLRNWLSDKNGEDYAMIQSAYCHYVLNVFSDGETGMRYDTDVTVDPVNQLFSSRETENAQGLLRGTDVARYQKTVDIPAYVKPVTEIKLPAADADAKLVENALAALLAKMKLLYDVVYQTTDEYNEYLGAQNIRSLTSTVVHDGMNVKMYTVLISFFFLVLGCCGAILLGRTEDILEYVFLKDHATGAMNRQAYDNYIRKVSKSVLPQQRTCISLRISNQPMLNEKYGREKTDAVVVECARTLKDCLADMPNTFIAYNGSGYFFAFYDLQDGTSKQERKRLISTLRQNVSINETQYQLGVANAAEENLYNIRPLISKACEKQRTYSCAETK